MSNVETWSETAAQNDSAPPDGAPEGMSPPAVNDSMREIMAAVARWFGDAEWLNFPGTATVTKDSPFQVRIAGVDVTARFPVGRRVRLTGAVTQFGTVAASVLDTGDSLLAIGIDGGGVVDNGVTGIQAWIIEGTGTAALLDTGTGGSQLPTNDDLALPAFGTAASVDTGTDPGDVPLNSDLGSAAYTEAVAPARQIARKIGTQTVDTSDTEISADNDPVSVGVNELQDSRSVSPGQVYEIEARAHLYVRDNVGASIWGHAVIFEDSVEVARWPMGHASTTNPPSGNLATQADAHVRRHHTVGAGVANLTVKIFATATGNDIRQCIGVDDGDASAGHVTYIQVQRVA